MPSLESAPVLVPSSHSQNHPGWLSLPSASVLIDVKGRKVHLTARGLPQKPGRAVVICEAGLAHHAVVWGAVQTLCAPFVRTYAYDRAGYHYSDPPITNEPRSATVIANELSDLLDAAGIDGPYILVGHSLGGVLVREFIELRNNDVAGVIFVDVVTERSNIESPTPYDEYEAICSGVDSYAVTGTRATHRLSPEDWDGLMANGPHARATVRAEQKAFQNETEKELTAKSQIERQVMGNKPVVVIKGNATADMTICVKKGIEAGNGTDEQRNIVLNYLMTAEDFRERHQRELLQLSSNSKWVVARKGGHNVHITEPELIAEEIQTIMMSLYGES